MNVEGNVMGDAGMMQKAFPEWCRDSGIRPTHQRIEIWRELAATRGHPDAESVFRSVRHRLPTVSLDTVYRTLCLFEEHGLVQRVDTVNGRARYDATTEMHAHFVCVRCSKVIDLDSPLAEVESYKGMVERNGFIVDSVHFSLRGACPECAAGNVARRVGREAALAETGKMSQV